ncbi:MAG: polysaccharide deacetylase family protein [Actinomycetota bacterium]|nr:polysaccharide deacetylase family protein [Actinomycetota bacterium]
MSAGRMRPAQALDDHGGVIQMKLSRRRVALLLAAVQAAGTLVVLAATPAAAAFPPSEWVVGPQTRSVIITLDGTARNKVMDELLLMLERKKADLSFFVPGAWIDHHETRARLVKRGGHLLGNRGYGKALFTSLDDAALRASISKAEDALRSIGATGMPYLRPPKGARDLDVLRVAGSMGYRSVRWTQHPKGGLAKKIAYKVVSRVQPGSIISLDVWRKSHRKALPKIIDRLRKRNYNLRQIDALANTHAVRWDVTLRAGDSGAEVAYLQKTLDEISYPVGRRDGSFGYETQQAVYAFEKVKGLTRDGVVTPQQMTQIALSRRPVVPSKGKPSRFVEVDISRQVLFEVKKGRVTHTLPISSGNEEYYTVDGETYKAHTPRGSFTIERKIEGVRVSRLGKLYHPSYFVGGYAIHGSQSVPVYPASHGCVRIPMYVRKAFFRRTPVGKAVFVHN